MKKVNKLLGGVFAVLVIAAVILIININSDDQGDTSSLNSPSVGSVSEDTGDSGDDLSKGDQIIADAFKNKKSDVQVEGQGTVIKLLADDTKGNEHQKFIVELASGQTIMFAHNISISDKIKDLKVGDEIKFAGEYIWNDEGGLVHWTHHDPEKKHSDGWLEHNGNRYD